MKALRIELTETLAYWTVVDDGWVPVPAADSFLRHLRVGADRAEGTTPVASSWPSRARKASTALRPGRGGQ